MCRSIFNQEITWSLACPSTIYIRIYKILTVQIKCIQCACTCDEHVYITCICVVIKFTYCGCGYGI